VLYLHPGGVLADDVPAMSTAPSTFTYDPADPTPAVGGRVLGPAAGMRDNRRLEARPDVLTFTGPALAADLEVVGYPVVELAHRSDNPYADVFVRLCEVDGRGGSRNVSDGFIRLTEADRDAQVVRVQLDALAHRFGAGKRIRVQVSGGAHPRFARNLGTEEPAAAGSRMRPSRRSIAHDGRSRLLLPVAAR
jgi:putative CocE/NonD family hydrolase